MLNFIIRHQIADKFSLKFQLCITCVERVIQTCLLLFLVCFRVPSAFVQTYQNHVAE